MSDCIEFDRNNIVVSNEKKDQLNFLRALAAEYSSVYYVDLSDNILHPYVINYVVKKKYGELLNSGVTLEEGLGKLFKEEAYEGDRERVLSAIQPEYIKKALAKNKRSSLVFRHYGFGGSLEYARMKMVKVDDADREPTAIAIGFSHENEEVISRFVSEKLVAEYDDIYYIDIDNDLMFPLRDMIVRNTDFFTEASYSEMMESLALKVRSGKEKILELADADKLRTFLSEEPLREIVYELPEIEHPWRRSVWIVMDRDVSGLPQTVLATFRALDTATTKEKRIESHIQKALSDEYCNYYCVDLESGEIITRSLDATADRYYGQLLMLNATYQDIAEHYVNNFVVTEDRKRVSEACNLENVVEKFRILDDFSVYYLTTFTGKPTYRRMRFSMVKTIEDKKYFVWAFADVDKRVRSNMEHSRALAANKAKSTFLFNMSHDIRTPMNAIIGYTQMAMKYIDNRDKVMDCLGKVSVSSDHLLQLINDVLDMARIESGKVNIEEKETTIMAYADNIVSMIRSTAEAKNIDFQHQYKNIVDKGIYADILHVNQIIINLLSNAIKYTNSGGTVIYTIEQIKPQQEGYASYRFTVEDNGIGMSEEFLQHIFENFSRERNTTASGIQGTGLGMSIVKKLVDLMNGTIDIKSEVGKGTVITVELSFREVQKKGSCITSPIIGQSKADLTGMKVLLVEDNEMNLEIAKEILLDSGIIVDEADDGSVAVEKIKNAEPGQYDLVLMDIQMPFMDGYQATMEIRRLKESWLANIPIVAMTANVFEEDKRKAREVGMNGHLAKPINVSELLKLLQLFKK